MNEIPNKTLPSFSISGQTFNVIFYCCIFLLIFLKHIIDDEAIVYRIDMFLDNNNKTSHLDPFELNAMFVMDKMC